MKCPVCKNDLRLVSKDKYIHQFICDDCMTTVFPPSDWEKIKGYISVEAEYDE